MNREIIPPFSCPPLTSNVCSWQRYFVNDGHAVSGWVLWDMAIMRVADRMSLRVNVRRWFGWQYVDLTLALTAVSLR